MPLETAAPGAQYHQRRRGAGLDEGRGCASRKPTEEETLRRPVTPRFVYLEVDENTMPTTPEDTSAKVDDRTMLCPSSADKGLPVIPSPAEGSCRGPLDKGELSFKAMVAPLCAGSKATRELPAQTEKFQFRRFRAVSCANEIPNLYARPKTEKKAQTQAAWPWAKDPLASIEARSSLFNGVMAPTGAMPADTTSAAEVANLYNYVASSKQFGAVYGRSSSPEYNQKPLQVTGAPIEAASLENFFDSTQQHMYLAGQGAGRRYHDGLWKPCFMKAPSACGSTQNSAPPAVRTLRTGKYSIPCAIKRGRGDHCESKDALPTPCSGRRCSVSLQHPVQRRCFVPLEDHDAYREGRKELRHRCMQTRLLPGDSRLLGYQSMQPACSATPTPETDTRFKANSNSAFSPQDGSETGDVLTGGPENGTNPAMEITSLLPAHRSVGEAHALNPFMESLDSCGPQKVVGGTSNRTIYHAHEDNVLAQAAGALLAQTTKDRLRTTTRRLSFGEQGPPLVASDMASAVGEGLWQRDVVTVGNNRCPASPACEGHPQHRRSKKTVPRLSEQTPLERHPQKHAVARLVDARKQLEGEIREKSFFVKRTHPSEASSPLTIPNLLAVEEQRFGFVAGGTQGARKRGLLGNCGQERSGTRELHVPEPPSTADFFHAAAHTSASAKENVGSCLTQVQDVTFDAATEPSWKEVERIPLLRCATESLSGCNQGILEQVETVGHREYEALSPREIKPLTKDAQQSVLYPCDTAFASRREGPAAANDEPQTCANLAEASWAWPSHRRHRHENAYHLPEPGVTTRGSNAQTGKQDEVEGFSLSAGKSRASEKAKTDKRAADTQSGASDEDASTEGEEVAVPMSARRPSKRSPRRSGSLTPFGPGHRRVSSPSGAPGAAWLERSSTMTNSTNISKDFDDDSSTLSSNVPLAAQAKKERDSLLGEPSHSQKINGGRVTASLRDTDGHTPCPLRETAEQRQPTFYGGMQHASITRRVKGLRANCNIASDAELARETKSSSLPCKSIWEIPIVNTLSSKPAIEGRTLVKRVSQEVHADNIESPSPSVKSPSSEDVRATESVEKLTNSPDENESSGSRADEDAELAREVERQRGSAVSPQARYLSQHGNLHVHTTALAHGARDQETIDSTAQGQKARAAVDCKVEACSGGHAATIKMNQFSKETSETDGTDTEVIPSRRETADKDTLWAEGRMRKQLLQQLMEEHTEVRRLLKQHKEEMERLLLSSDLNVCAENEQQLRLERQLLLDLYLLQEALDGGKREENFTCPPHSHEPTRAATAIQTLRQSISKLQRRKHLRAPFEPAGAGGFSKIVRERPREICTAFRAQSRAKSFTGLDPVCVIATLRRMKEAANCGGPLQEGVPAHPYLSVKSVTAGGLRWDDLDRKLAHLHNSHTGCLRWKKTSRGVYLYGNTQVTLSVAGGKILAQHHARGEDFRRIWNRGDRGDVLKFMAFCDARREEKNRPPTHQSQTSVTDRFK